MLLVHFWTNIGIFSVFLNVCCVLCNFMSPKGPYDDGNVVRSSKSQNHWKCSKIIENQVFWTMYELFGILWGGRHVSRTFLDKYMSFCCILKRFLCFYTTFWVQNDHMTREIWYVRVSHKINENTPKSQKIMYFGQCANSWHIVRWCACF